MSCGVAMSVLACTLGEDFEPVAVEPTQVVAADGSGGSTTSPPACADVRGCCTVNEDCDTGEVCVAGVCEQQETCTSLDEVSVCQLELCPGPNCPDNLPGPSCSDGARNGDEAGIDCGGSCPGACAAPAPPSCEDQLRNQDETGVDCGGSCTAKCAQGDGCGADADCEAPLLCSPSSRVCTAISCADGQQNGDEILVDCGGSVCPGCPIGTACLNASDCTSSICAL